MRTCGAPTPAATGLLYTSLLREGQLLFSAGCRRTVEEFQSYLWDETAAAQGEDRPVKEHDHCMDALRYFVTTVACRESGRVARRPRGL